jgi:diguanylate cyclase (GGDEF)-like protein
MTKSLHVLIIDDTEGDVGSLLDALKRGGYDPAYTRVDTPDALRAALGEQAWEVVIYYSSPLLSAADALALLKERGLDLPFIVQADALGEEAAMAAMKAGAHDYVQRDDLARLVPALERELRVVELRAAFRQAEAAVMEAAEKVARWATEVEQRNREITLLNELSSRLQSCLTTDEAFAAIAELAQKLFPAEAGLLYMLTPSRTLESAVGWGGQAAGDAFASDECWALRRGRMHVVDDPRSGQMCPHLGEAVPGPYVCVPMMAQGEAVGVLHLRRPSAPDQPEVFPGPFTESDQRLAQTVAEHLALALANLKLRETLRLESSRDPLTGLFNRRYLEEALERELRRAARKARPLGVILLDLDDFAAFNEAHGHGVGDALLRLAGGFLQKHIRGEDVAGRSGGEEFILILPEASLDVTRQRADKLRDEFEQLLLEFRGQTLSVTPLSAGVAVFPDHGETMEAILAAVEAALRQSRAERREHAAPALVAEPSPPADVESAVAAPAPEAPPPDKPATGSLRVTVGALSLNPQTFELTVGDKVIRPTPAEYELLSFLMRNAGQVFTSEQLLQQVWNYPPGTGSHESVRAHIKNLRSKIEPDPKHPIYLKTIGRFGYSIPAEESVEVPTIDAQQ